MTKGNRQLLVQTFTLTMPSKEGIRQSIIKNKGVLYLTGRLQYADKQNGNGRIYPKYILQRQINRYQQKIKANISLGQCDHPDSDSISLKNVAILVKQVHWQGNQVVGTIQLLTNSVGRDMQALVQDGVTLSISSRGMGSLKHKDGYDYVQQDFELVGWDLVVQPSTQGASFYNKGIRSESIQTRLQTILDSKTAEDVTYNFNIKQMVNQIMLVLNKESK